MNGRGKSGESKYVISYRIADCQLEGGIKSLLERLNDIQNGGSLKWWEWGTV